MRVELLDHINIITRDLKASARFYAELLDLEERNGAPSMPPEKVRWMYDRNGRAILHLNALDYPRAYDRAIEPGAETGAIHHVALRCEGFDEMIARLDARGADYTINNIPSAGLRQIFTADLDNVLLELNFYVG
jgi:catechol 2,3-dioxygenase-like lactoylglutathione lyase family enzyme